jgi:tRNA(Ile)-lysidine synthase
MALMHGLIALNKQHDFGLELHIAHLDHRLRGSESEEDAAFVHAAADAAGLPCLVERIDVAAQASASGTSIEEAARRSRYEFLERVCLKTGAKIVAVGHHADDNAETVLHRILRGTGLRGLAGVIRKRALHYGSEITLVRPMLRFRRQEIVDFLNEVGIPWREDSSNESNEFIRNRLRNIVLPMLAEQVNPQVHDALIRLAELAQWQQEYLNETAQRTFETLIISRTDQELVLNAASMARKSRIVQTELVRRAFVSFQLGEQDLAFGHLVSVVELAADTESGKQAHLPGGMTVEKRYDRLTFSMPTEEPRESVASEVAVHVPGTTTLAIRRLCIGCNFLEPRPDELRTIRQRDRSDDEWLDAHQVHLPLVVRARRPGDRFWPLGATGSKKVSDFLSDAKVAPGARDQVAVLCDQLGPIWLIGHRIDERVKVTPRTKRVLRVQAKPTGA